MKRANKTEAQILAESNALDASYSAAADADSKYLQTVTKYKVYWDIEHTCDVFPELYDTEAEAQQAAEDIYDENIAEGIWDEETCSTEVIAVQVPIADPDEQEKSFDPIRMGWLDRQGRP